MFGVLMYRIHVLGQDDEQPELKRPWPPQSLWTELGLIEPPAKQNPASQSQQQKKKAAPATASAART